MKVTLKLLQDYGDFKSGKLVTVAEEDVQAMLDQGIAEKYVPLITVKEATEKATVALDEALKTAVKDFKLPNVTMIKD